MNHEIPVDLTEPCSPAAYSDRRLLALSRLEARGGRDKLGAVSNAMQSAAAKAPVAPLTASAIRVERRFLPTSGSASKLGLGLGMLGSAALGAGVYGLWLAPRSVDGAFVCLLGGLAASVGAFFISPGAALPVRVGELGILIGDPAEVARVHWYEIKSLRIVGDALAIEGPSGSLTVPLASHARAVARILAEAAVRIGARVDVSPKAHERLPALADLDGEIVPAERLQFAGQKCTESGKSITFESDARVCENCAALYHDKHVPAACVRCEQPLAARPASAARAAG